MSQQGENEADLNTQILKEQRQTNALLRELVKATTSATELVEQEARERKAEAAEIRSEGHRTRRLLKFAIGSIFFLVLVVGGVGYGINRQQIESSKTPCSERIETRRDIRSAILSGVDEVGRYAELTPAEQNAINDRVARRVYETLPNPDCSSKEAGLPYLNCDAARQDGAIPLYQSDPGYSPALDDDGDGVACDGEGG